MFSASLNSENESIRFILDIAFNFYLLVECLPYYYDFCLFFKIR